MLKKAIVIFFLIAFPSISFSFSKVNVVADCNADRTGHKDSTSAIQTCIDNAKGEATIYFPPGTYLFEKTLLISNNNVTLTSDSRASANLVFTGSGSLIRFFKEKTEIFNGGISHLLLSGDGKQQQTAIDISDGSWISINDVQIHSFNDPSNESIGIKVKGREGFNVTNVTIEANKPIVLGKNPNHEYLDADHFRFENIYTSVIGNGNKSWQFTLEDGVTVTNMTIDGQNPMTGGCGIIKWVTKTKHPLSVSYHLKLSNTRHEQLATECDNKDDNKVIYISLPLSKPLQQLIIDNIYLSGQDAGKWPESANAIYTEGVDSISVRDTTYTNPNRKNSHFINSTGAKFIELSNNHTYLYEEQIVTTSPTLSWIAGPYRGKECCDPPGVRTPVSGILSVVPPVVPKPVKPKTN